MHLTTQRLVTGAVRVVNNAHLRWIPRAIVRRLPPKLRLRLSKLQVRLGFMDGLLLVPEADLERSYQAALELLRASANESLGTYLEFGVYIGTSIACMYRAASRIGADIRLVGFDSFEGLPKDAAREDGGVWRPGQYYSDLELTNWNLARLGVPLSRVDLVPGWYEESLTAETRDRLGLDRAAVVMVDCDLASSARAALEFCLPLIPARTIFFFDDWSINSLAERGLGERKAFEDWLSAHPELDAQEIPDLQYAAKARAFLVTRRASS